MFGCHTKESKQQPNEHVLWDLRIMTDKKQETNSTKVPVLTPSSMCPKVFSGLDKEENFLAWDE
jgi:hypothetical protein